MQEINLYQDEFRRRSRPLSPGQLAAAATVLFVSLFLLWGWRQWQNLALQQQLQQARQAHSQSQQQLQAARKTYIIPKADPALAERLARLQQEVNLKQQMQQVFSGRQSGNTRGFVEHMSGLARQRIEGLWLTGVRIRQGGLQLGMQGKLLRAELLPQYLQRLRGEAVFAGAEFTRFRMQRQAQKPHLIEFTLNSPDGKEAQ